MIPLSKYGKTIREYIGEGFLTLYDGQTCKCRVLVVQMSNGKIIASCLFKENIDLVHKCLDKDNAIKSIQGTTKENEDFYLDGHLLYTSFNEQIDPSGHITITMFVFASSVTVQKQTSSQLKSVRFGIVNFEFLGNKVKEYAKGGGGLDILGISLDDGFVEIQAIQDYKNIMETIKAQRGIDVTSEMIMNLSSIDDLNTVIPLIDTLCKLLSLARGTKINWIYYECFNSVGNKVSGFHKNTIVWQYVGLPLIDPMNPHDTAKFVNQSFSTYLLHKNDLDIAIETYLDAKRETGYLEIRALKAVVVLEFLKSRYAIQKGVDLILKNNQFKKIRHNVELELAERLQAMSLSECTLNEMKEKISELNRRSFSAILEIMFEDLDIGITKDELSRFIKIRNSLVHKASFITKEYWNEYTFIIGILDIIFLKILNYNGTFLNIKNKFNRIDTTQLEAFNKGKAH